MKPLVKRLMIATELVRVEFYSSKEDAQQGRIAVTDVLGRRTRVYRASERQLNWFANETNAVLLAQAGTSYTQLTAWFNAHAAEAT